MKTVNGMIGPAEEHGDARVHRTAVFANDMDTGEQFTVVRGLEAEKAVGQERLAIEGCGPRRAVCRARRAHLNRNLEALIGRKQDMRLGGLRRICDKAEKNRQENAAERFEKPAFCRRAHM